MDRRSSSPLVKLAAFAVVLAATFAGGALIGAAVGPDPSSPPPSAPHPTSHDQVGHG
jgi:hypothetical protein